VVLLRRHSGHHRLLRFNRLENHQKSAAHNRQYGRLTASRSGSPNDLDPNTYRHPGSLISWGRCAETWMRLWSCWIASILTSKPTSSLAGERRGLPYPMGAWTSQRVNRWDRTQPGSGTPSPPREGLRGAQEDPDLTDPRSGSHPCTQRLG
jgi:hypothetical protein